VRFSPPPPEVQDPRARWVLDWVQTLAYIFWVVFLATAAVLALSHGVSALDLLRIAST
jgi:hypothetical protein